MVLHGYGKILEVDLSTGNVVKRDTDLAFAREFVGGMGFGCKILYDEVGPGVDPLGPDNIIVFANGPLTGTSAPCGGRTEITTKSALTGHIGTGNTGGVWGARLKHAGIDAIIIRKQAAKPVYIWIDDAKVEIRDAGHLWGRDTWMTSEAIRQELDRSLEAPISVLAIGPAGENLVKFACPINDYHHCAARSTAGAVMGAKKLKAIAVRGTGNVNIARPEEFRAAVREARERIKEMTAANQLPPLATDARSADADRGCLEGRNYQTGYIPHFAETRGIHLAKKYFTKTEGTCYACPIPCFNLVEVKEGKYAGVKANRGLMPGVVYEWGAKLDIDNLPAIWKCKEMCQHLGMDYISAGGSIAFATELMQRGIITVKDTNGVELIWGNDDAFVLMLHQIAYREGFGEILAEGSTKAAARIGRGAEKYVMATKGADMMTRDPRSGNKSWVFGPLTNPRGGDNIKNTHSMAARYNPKWWVDKFDMFDDVKAKAYSIPPQETGNTWEGKPTLCKWLEDLYSLINSLGVCFFPAGFRLAIGPTYYAKLYSACTGWDVTPQDMMKAGEKNFTLLKAYTMREGLTRKDDMYPDRFFTEPLPEGPAKGAILSRDTIESLLDEYYELREWDKKTGLPTKEKLNRLGLNDIATNLQKSGKLP